jgi:hypothetical protein
VWFKTSPGKKQDPISKIPNIHKKKKKKAGGMAQVVDHLPSKCDALEFKPQYGKNKYVK